MRSYEPPESDDSAKLDEFDPSKHSLVIRTHRLEDVQRGAKRADESISQMPLPPSEDIGDGKIEYSQRLVAFLDILGWGRLVDSSITSSETFDQLSGVLTEIQFFSTLPLRFALLAKNPKFKVKGDPQITQFSDSLLLSTEPNIDGRMLLSTWLGTVMTKLLKAGILVRGGVTLGPAFHEGSLVFGPAITAAYRLEQIAVYPRIIIDPSMAEKWTAPIPVVNEAQEVVDHWQCWRRDSDGLYFFDFLNKDAFLVKSDPQGNDLDFPFDEKLFQRTLTAGIEKNRDSPSILAKFGWLENYYKAVLAMRNQHH